MKYSIFPYLLGLLFFSCCKAYDNPVLSIEGGRVQGELICDSLTSRLPAVIVYKGIPYAAPPIGDLRWRAPQPVEPWDTILLANQFRTAALQATHNPNDGSYGTEFFPEDAPFSEDCLHLNIWTPYSAANHSEKKLPVCLWIHGGAYMAGWSFEREMDGEKWARNGVILVTANYRLGILGYLSHPLLTAESGTSGNYGLMDQIYALQWIKRNIAQFGGDPDNITIMGQSAGGGSVRCMAISPKSRDLVSRVIVMSAGGLGSRLKENATQAQADSMGQAIMEAGGFTTVEQMRNASFDRLVQAKDNYDRTHGWTMLGPHIDGTMLVESFDQAAALGHMADVPYMFGSVADDAKGLDVGFQPLAELRQTYSQQPMYIYRFEAPLPTDGRPALTGAFHSAELWYVFGTQERSWRPFTDSDKDLSHKIIYLWTNFARSGNPCDGPLEYHWPHTTKERPFVQVLRRE